MSTSVSPAVAAALLALSPEELAKIPAGVPPAGIVSNFDNPPTRGPILLVVGSVFLALMLIMASLRFYTKVHILRRVSWDDYTCAAAVLGTIIYFIICCYGVTEGKFGTHTWDMSLGHLLSKNFQIPGFFVDFLSSIVWGLAKMTFFLLYLQLFSPIIWLRYLIFFGATVNILFYTAIVIATLCYTSPAPHQSWAAQYLSSGEGGALRMTIPITAGSLVLDVYIFLLPMFGIFPLRLSSARKIGLLVVFATGLMACVASSIGIYYRCILDRNLLDYTYHLLPVLVMALVEMCVGISASCMPSLSKLAGHRGYWTRFCHKLAKVVGFVLHRDMTNMETDDSKEISTPVRQGREAPHETMSRTHAQASVFELPNEPQVFELCEEPRVSKFDGNQSTKRVKTPEDFSRLSAEELVEEDENRLINAPHVGIKEAQSEKE